MNKICFYCGKEIEDNDIYWSEPIEGSYPYRYGNLFFHKELCYRQIENVHEYLTENKDRIFDVLANGVKVVPEKKIVTPSDKKEKKNRKTKRKK